MIILDEKIDKSISRLTLLLQQSEAEELRDSLESILKGKSGDHEHVPSEDYKKEITVALYEPSNIDGFNDRVQKLIRKDCQKKTK
ncbi:MAG: hypothetical protein ABFD91_07100 [Anaerohalosphaeraceae bacterium]